MNGLRIEIAETGRFQLDCELYSLGEDQKRRALDQLRSDPAIGRPYVESHALWEWQFGEFEIIYAISGDFSKLVLLELRPQSKKPGKVLDRVWKTIDRINAIKRLFGL